MTEITQADIDLQNELWKMSVNWGNRETMTEMIARHREQAAAEERAKIVAWHRTCPPHIAHCFDAADAIEAKEHLK